MAINNTVFICLHVWSCLKGQDVCSAIAQLSPCAFDRQSVRDLLGHQLLSSLGSVVYTRRYTAPEAVAYVEPTSY